MYWRDSPLRQPYGWSAEQFAIVVQRLVILGFVRSSAGSGVTAKETFVFWGVPFDTEVPFEERAGGGFDVMVGGATGCAPTGVLDVPAGDATDLAVGEGKGAGFKDACFAEEPLFCNDGFLWWKILFIKDLRGDF